MKNFLYEFIEGHGMPRDATNSKHANLTKTLLELKDNSMNWNVPNVTLIWYFNLMDPK